MRSGSEKRYLGRNPKRADNSGEGYNKERDVRIRQGAAAVGHDGVHERERQESQAHGEMRLVRSCGALLQLLLVTYFAAGRAAIGGGSRASSIATYA
jgi:hypothetical protein